MCFRWVAARGDAELPHPLAEVVRTGSLYRCSVAKLRGCGGKAE